MKSRIIKAAGVCAVCTVLTVSAGQQVAAENVTGVDLKAGVAVTLEEIFKNYNVENAQTVALEVPVTAAVETTQEEAAEQPVAQEPVQEATATDTFGYTNLGVANVDNYLNIRESAGENGKIVGKLPQHAGCEVLETSGDWYKIQSGKVTGYVKAEYLLTGESALSKAQEVKKNVAIVNTTTLNVRAEANTDAKIITLVPIEEELDILEDQGDWLKISIDSDEGYVKKEFVTVSSELPKAVSMSELTYGTGVSDVRVSMVAYAKQFLGNPYVWGGTSLTNGTDCSGFTMGIYKNFGISLPHSSKAQSGYGTKISVSEAKPGDLFFYGKGSSVNHVAMYIGNGQVIHASTKKTGIKISNATYRTPICVRRIIND